MKTDLLAFGAHPDDVELGCGGTLLVHQSMGKKTAIIDLTRGELGTRGTPGIRQKEARDAARMLNVLFRENLELEDGFFENNRENRIKIICMIRKFKPEIVLTNAGIDRHPDHVCASKLVSDACFLAGLEKIKTKSGNKPQDAWRPKSVLHYIQFLPLVPALVVDISPFFKRKMEAIRCFKSQFYNPGSNEPETVLTTPDFFETVTGKARIFGRQIGVEFGEGFISNRMIGVNNLFMLK